MTLILGMSKPDGVYLSADYRVTVGARTLPDAVKFLTVQYPPEKTGPRALFGYTGIAILSDGTPTGVWIRETLRGESDVFDVSMAHLCERLNRDVAHLRQPLMIMVLAIEGELRFLGGFSNVRRDLSALDSFEYQLHELKQWVYFGNGSGVFHMNQDQRGLLASQLAVIPRNPLDHMRLLANVNRQVAAVDRGVSPYCHVSFMNATEHSSSQSRVFTEAGEEVEFSMPSLLFGIDLDYMAKQFHEQAAAIRRGEATDIDFDTERMNEEVRRRP